MQSSKSSLSTQASYLCVQTQENEHDKEADGPQLGQRHHGYSLRVCNEGQAGTWKTASQRCKTNFPPQSALQQYAIQMVIRNKFREATNTETSLPKYCGVVGGGQA